MCQTIGYKSAACGHRWLVIIKQCAPNMGFTNTPMHEFRFNGVSLFGRPTYQLAPAGTCPNCDRRGQYDGNTIRMLLARGESGIQKKFQQPTIQAPLGAQQGHMQPAAPGAFQGVIGPNQVLSPYQMQFAANQQNLAIARMQYFPNQEPYKWDGGRCGIM